MVTYNHGIWGNSQYRTVIACAHAQDHALNI